MEKFNFISYFMILFQVSKLNKEISGLEKPSLIANKENNYSFPSRVLFTWMFPFIKNGCKRDLTADHTWRLSPENSVKSTYALFQTAWDHM